MSSAASSSRKKTVVVTGGTAGIGYHAALAFAVKGHRVVVTTRSAEKGAEAVRQLMEEANNSDAQVDYVVGDLSPVAAVDKLAVAILEKTSDQTESRIDVLVNNAGYLGGAMKKTEDDVEMHFAVNVLAPYRLAQKLLPALKASASAAGPAGFSRVVNVSGGDAPAQVDVGNLQAEKGFRGLMTYTHSKSCLEAVSMVLARDLLPAKVLVNVVFPGRATTAMTTGLTSKHLPGPMKLFLPCFRCMFKADGGKSAQKAARSTVFAAEDEAIGEKGVTGKYFDTNCKEQKLHKSAYDEEVQKKIVGVIEKATGSGNAGHP